MLPEQAPRLSKNQDLGMGRRIVQFGLPIARGGDYSATVDQNRTHRAFTAITRRLRFEQGLSHEGTIVGPDCDECDLHAVHWCSLANRLPNAGDASLAQSGIGRSAVPHRFLGARPQIQFRALWRSEAIDVARVYSFR